MILTFDPNRPRRAVDVKAPEAFDAVGDGWKPEQLYSFSEVFILLSVESQRCVHGFALELLRLERKRDQRRRDIEKGGA